MRTAVIFCLLVSSALVAQNRAIDSLERIIAGADKERAAVERASLALKYYSAGDVKRAMSSLDLAAKDAVQSGSHKALGAVYNTRGIFHYYSAAYDSALANFTKALDHRMKANDKQGVLKTMSNMAGIHQSNMRYTDALQLYEQALNLEREYGFAEGEHVSLNNIAVIYSALKMTKKSLSFLHKMAARYRSTGQDAHLVMSYDGLALAHKDLGRKDSALFYSDAELSLAEKIGDISELAYAELTRGIILIDKKSYREAERYLRMSLDKARQLKDERLEMGAYGNLAAIHILQNNMDSAVRYLDKVVPLQQKLKVKNMEEDLAQVYAEYYYRKKDYQKAYDYMMIYDRVHDSLYRQETAGKIAEMQEKYQSERKEQENKVLTLEVTRVSQARNYLVGILVLAVIAMAGGLVAYRRIRAASQEISRQKEMVDEKQRDILDSIHYAKRIQMALVTGEAIFRESFPDSFIYFNPKDVVSGDFYWAVKTPDAFIYVTADCTGHGVPGAFMSLLNISKLTQAITERNITRPDLILNYVRTEIIEVLNPKSSDEQSKDGMDAVVCSINYKTGLLQFAAANNSFYIVRNGEMLHCKADKMPVGKGHDDNIPFTLGEMQLKSGDTIYTFTDGYADQFGGEFGKKFKYKPFEQFVLSINGESMQRQRELLAERFDAWKGSLAQVDDVCVIGIRIA